MRTVLNYLFKYEISQDPKFSIPGEGTLARERGSLTDSRGKRRERPALRASDVTIHWRTIHSIARPGGQAEQTLSKATIRFGLATTERM